MPLLASLPLHRNKVRLFEKLQVLGYGLAREGKAFAQLPQSLAALLVQAVEEATAVRISESPEDPIVGGGAGCELWKGIDRVHQGYYMQSSTCMSIIPCQYGCCVAQVLHGLELVDDRRPFTEREILGLNN